MNYDKYYLTILNVDIHGMVWQVISKHSFQECPQTKQAKVTDVTPEDSQEVNIGHRPGLVIDRKTIFNQHIFNAIGSSLYFLLFFFQDRFVAVAYTNRPSYFIGKVVARKDRLLSVTFLAKAKHSEIYEWPKTEQVQDVFSHQVFQDYLCPTGPPGEFAFHVSNSRFNECMMELKKVERKSKVSDI